MQKLDVLSPRGSHLGNRVAETRSSADRLSRMDLQKILSDLRSQRSRLERAITALEGLAPKRGPGRPRKTSISPAPKRFRMSADARRRISEPRQEKKPSRLWQRPQWCAIRRVASTGIPQFINVNRAFTFAPGVSPMSLTVKLIGNVVSATTGMDNSNAQISAEPNSDMRCCTASRSTGMREFRVRRR